MDPGDFLPHDHRGDLVLGIEAESVRASIVRIFFLLLGAMVAITGAMLLLLWILLARLLDSLRTLVRAMDSLDLEGGTLPRLPDRSDEIGILFRHFQNMGQRLSRSGST